MKFTASASELKSALRAACEVVPSRAILPEQSCIFMQAKGDSLRVFGRDETAEIALSCACSVQREGQALVPARTFLDYVSLASVDVSVSVDQKNVMTIVSGNKKSTVTCLDSDRFRPLDFGGQPLFTAPGSRLAACFDRVSFAVSTDETRKQICGVHMDIDPGGLVRFVAMDGFRVALCALPVALSGPLPENKKLIVPSEVLKLISSLFSGASSVSFVVEQYRACLESEDRQLAFPLMTKEYVQYERVIPKSYSVRVLLSARAFMDALNLTSIAAAAAPANSQRQNLIRLVVSSQENTVRLSADSDSTTADTDVPCLVEGPDMIVFFNVNYLKDSTAVSMKESDDLLLCFTTNVGVCMAAPKESENALQTFVVPVRVRE